MATIKEYQVKIANLRNTRKITGSMKMISSIKMQQMTKTAESFSPFAEESARIASCMAGLASREGSLWFDGWKETKRVRLLLVTGDRGLCGRFNMNTVKTCLQRIGEETAGNRSVVVSCIGNKGHAYLKRFGMPVDVNYEGIIGRPQWSAIDGVADDVLKEFSSGRTQQIWVVYTKRRGGFYEEPVIEPILPLPGALKEAANVDYLLEETPDGLCDVAARLFVRSVIFGAVIGSALAEQTARMTAMESASSNCDRMISKYMQLRNRARQSAITTELNEIVTGKEALES